MLLDDLGLDRAKGVQPDVQGDEGQADAPLAQAEEQVGREMQPGGRRGDRSLDAAVDGLVALGVV